MDVFSTTVDTQLASCAPGQDAVFPTPESEVTADNVEPTSFALPAKSAAAQFKERARKREIASYLSAASVPPGLAVSTTPLREVSKDANITALVQLGAFRLGTDRAFLSLIDGAFQYVISESTRTNSLAQADETMFLGVSKLPLSFGVCPRTIDYFNDETGKMVINTPNVVADRSRYIINDFRVDPHYATRPYVTGFPYMVSYAEVPLISPLGYILGSYCVVDSKLRDFDNDETIAVLSELAAAIMTHMDLVRLKQSRARAEQLLDGLGQFMEYESNIPRRERESSLSEGTSSNAEFGRSTSSNNREADLEVTIRTDNDDSSSSSVFITRPPLRSYPSTSDYSVQTDPHSGDSGDSAFTTSGKASSGTPPMPPSQSAELNPFAAMELLNLNSTNSSAKPSDEPTPVAPLAISQPEAPNTASLFSIDVRSTFTRAAMLIRETMSMDGLVFLDACPTGFNTRSNNSTTREKLDPFESDTAEEMTDQEYEKSVTYSEIIAGSLSPLEIQAGFSLSDPSRRISEAIVQRFIRRFPRGNVFSADEFGPIDCNFGPGTSCEARKLHRRSSSRLNNDVDELFQFVPGARYIIFLPLWHFQRETWFGAAFGYVKSPTEAVDMDDLNLLTAFGNSIMAEVSRFEALAVSRAKGDFINSISHELRSPLHGIMASGEMLREAVTDPAVLSMLDMIDSCGTTLLDTVNSILDYSKINNVSKSLEAGEHDGFALVRGQSPAGSLTDLSALVTEVVEGVHLGFTKTSYQMVSERESVFALSFGSYQGSEVLPDDTVLVTLHIQKKHSWITKVDTGAWRRIVMNIFGNALKYTRSGHIEVGLKLVQVQDSKGRARSYISFSCHDTGIGMSREYKKYQLFQPWAQEDSLSPGTGLGLSIVNRLVKALHGSLNVDSETGVGTTVTVKVPLHPDYGGPLLLHLPPISEMALSDAIHTLKNLSLSYVTPDAYKTTIDHDFEITGDVQQRSSAIKRALVSNARDALGMKVSPVREDITSVTDFIFFDAHLLGRSVNCVVSNDKFQKLFGSAPVIVLFSGRATSTQLQRLKLLGNTFEVRHPLGPKKLASILLEALQRSKEGLETTPHPLEAPLVSRTGEEGIKLDIPVQATPPVVLPKADNVHEIEINPTPPLTHSANPSPDFLSTPTETIPPSPSTPTISLPQQRLLLVDDNPINLRILTTLVHKMPNCTYVTATNGLEALQVFQSSPQPFSLIFMDISMPVMDGFTAIREIRSWEKAKKMRASKIVALTGLGSASSKQEAFASGTNLFLTKPVKLAEVRRLMTEEDGEGAAKG